MNQATTPQLPDIAAMRQLVQRGESRPLRWRQEQLQRLQTLLTRHEQQLIEALGHDLGKPQLEASMELVLVHQELRLTRSQLRRWMAPEALPLAVFLQPGQASRVCEPLGCVLILSPWNYPLQLCLHPLVHALAAGNTAVLKPSEHAPATGALLAELISANFAAEVVQVVLGDGATAATLLQERFDHIVFTGSGRVGQLVMQAAARHLTPVTLELGGKSPAIVLADADVTVTARRLIWGKGFNAGQTCVAPDHLLVTPALRQPLIEAIASAWRQFHGEDPLTSPDYGSIVNEGHFQRLEGLLAEARRRGQVLIGGRSDASSRRIEPTLLAVDDPDGDPLLQEELFGPLLPLITVPSLEQALERVRRGAKPLAIYLFGGDRRARRLLQQSSSSGTVTYNDVVLQAGLVTLPFGGVGASGMGTYHGESGFLTFSHLRSLLSRPFRLDLPFRYPPYQLSPDLLRRLLR